MTLEIAVDAYVGIYPVSVDRDKIKFSIPPKKFSEIRKRFKQSFPIADFWDTLTRRNQPGEILTLDVEHAIHKGEPYLRFWDPCAIDGVEERIQPSSTATAYFPKQTIIIPRSSLNYARIGKYPLIAAYQEGETFAFWNYTRFRRAGSP